MTAIPQSSIAGRRAFVSAPLMLALLAGVVIGSISTFVVTEELLAPDAAASVAVADANTATEAARYAAASEQYVGWYTRPPMGAAKWSTATDQYTALWYARAADLAGTTTATEQYVSWYMRDE